MHHHQLDTLPSLTLVLAEPVGFEPTEPSYDDSPV